MAPKERVQGTRSLFTAIDQSPGENARLNRNQDRKGRRGERGPDPLLGFRLLRLQMDSRLEEVFCGTVHPGCKVHSCDQRKLAFHDLTSDHI